MRKHLLDVKIISWGLAILYAVSLSVYLQTFRYATPDTRSLMLSTIFGILFIGAFGVVMLRNWGRMLLLIGNIFLCVYMLIPYFGRLEHLIPICYVLMSFVVLLFFTQDKIREMFKRAVETKEWRSILIVDDDEAIIKTVRSILMTQGFSILSTNSGEDGFYIAKKQRPDLIILDVIMPGMKGRELCKKIKADEAIKHIPVIFLTAKDSQDDIQAEKDVGATDHLTKPINAKLLISTINNILKK